MGEDAHILHDKSTLGLASEKDRAFRTTLIVNYKKEEDATEAEAGEVASDHPRMLHRQRPAIGRAVVDKHACVGFFRNIG